MRDIFPEFYINKSPINFNKLGKDVLIVFDTNVLLDLYRSSAKLREELIKTITLLKDNIWMPYQVGYEFHINRKDLMHEIKIDRDSFVDDIRNKFDKVINESIEKFKKKNKLYEEIIQNHETDLKEISRNFNSKINRMNKKIKEMELGDYISFLEGIFEGKVADNKEYNYVQWQSEAQIRYEEKKPPGYEDYKRKQNEFAFINGIKICKAYGDYFLWKEMLIKARNEEIKEVVFITNDQKEDWVYETKGRKIGARMELVEEMRRESKANFRIYSTSSLLFFTSSEENYQTIENEATNLSKLYKRDSDIMKLKEETDINRKELLVKISEIKERIIEAINVVTELETTEGSNLMINSIKLKLKKLSNSIDLTVFNLERTYFVPVEKNKDYLLRINHIEMQLIALESDLNLILLQSH